MRIALPPCCVCSAPLVSPSVVAEAGRLGTVAPTCAYLVARYSAPLPPVPCSALAGELRLNMCILNLSSAQGKLDDSNLIELFSSTPEDSLLVLEDVDAAFHGRTAVDGAAGGITFSGLLNAIVSPCGRCEVASTPCC